MPNWCENDLYVRGSRDRLSAFQEAVKGKSPTGEEVLISEDKIIPYPEEFRLLDEAALEFEKQHPHDWANRPKDGFNQGGYEWCIKNWGTKWGFCDIALVAERPRSLKYFFGTAWGPPLPLIRKLGAMFPRLSFRMRYFEQGAAFQGVLHIVKGEVERDETIDYHGTRGG